jgi:hypothetical protein
MDVDVIRIRFIEENLRCALQEHDRARAARALHAFRNYFQWFESRLPHPEKLIIRGQLARLEAAYPGDLYDDPLSDSSQTNAR